MRTTLIKLAVAAALTAAAGAIFWNAFAPPWDSDASYVARERAHRHALVKASQPLPGTPDVARLRQRLRDKGLTLGSSVFIRIFKREFELELWLQNGRRFEHFATYPICRWSGELGPKLMEGDGQSPEGFYTVDKRALNPNSRWHRSFNLGFPNAFDRAHGRTGSYLMVHGGCGSVGCYAMTDPVIDEIWRLITAALGSTQRTVHVHSFPFRMTEDNLADRAGNSWAEFWRELKAGYDAFELTRLPPRVTSCEGRYIVTPISAGEAWDRPLTAKCTATRAALPTSPPL